MKRIISNIITFLIAIVGFIGGGFWAYKSNWEMEPIILMTVSFFEIIGFILSKVFHEQNEELPNNHNLIKNNIQKIINNGKIEKQINIQENKGNIQM